MSLRAKVTGVTVAVLAIGLLASGVGTMVFLRNVLIGSVDDNASQLVKTDVWSAVFQVRPEGDTVSFSPKPNIPAPDYFVAVYSPEGDLLSVTGGGGAPNPVFPETFPLERTVGQGLAPFGIDNSNRGAGYRASVDLFQVNGVGDYYTQMVALPTAAVNRVVTAFISIYSLLALITVISAALLTRYAVTLTFRSLGQVETTADAIAAGDFSQRMTDIEPQKTEVGRLKTAINAMLARLDAALGERDASVRQMRRFIGDASHELRTPLVTVRGYAELYRMGAIQGDDDIAQAMDRIEKEAVRMGVLVEDLLALARLDERRDVVIGPVDLRPVARDAALDVRATSPGRIVTVADTTDLVAVPEPEPPPVTEPVTASTATVPRRRAGQPAPAGGIAGATLSLLRRRPRPIPATNAAGVGDAPPVTPVDFSTNSPSGIVDAAPIVLGDENRIRQVVANLVGNARRYTREDSPIELRIGVDAAESMGWIEVVDHGEGIPAQVRDKIFQRFWRADTSRARETGGSGLGLSIVASIVDALHGSVAVTDTPGGGATFRVGFPLAQSRDATEHVNLETQPLRRFDAP